MDNEENQIPRLNIFLKDLGQARKFAEYIVQRQWRDKDAGSRLVHLAFNTSLVVSYCRPFTSHKTLEGTLVRSSPLDQHVSEDLAPDERRLHDRLIKSRHTIYAHSDASAHLFSQKARLKKDPFYQLLTTPETAVLQAMIDKSMRYLRKERSKLKTLDRDNQIA